MRDSVGPPPEEVPRKVAVIHCDIYESKLLSLDELRNTVSYIHPHVKAPRTVTHQLDRLAAVQATEGNAFSRQPDAREPELL